jgi:hypothetical protein
VADEITTRFRTNRCRNGSSSTDRAGLARRITSSSLIGRLGSSTFRLSAAAASMSLTGSRFSSESAPGPNMGFEEEAEQSSPRPCRQTNGGSKRTCELTSSIVPRGTSFHRSVELEFPSIGFDPFIGFDPLDCSCCCRGLSPAPTELGAVHPDAVHDHGQSAGQGHDRLFHPRRLAICIAQALSQDHFFECNML